MIIPYLPRLTLLFAAIVSVATALIQLNLVGVAATGGASLIFTAQVVGISAAIALVSYLVAKSLDFPAKILPVVPIIAFIGAFVISDIAPFGMGTLLPAIGFTAALSAAMGFKGPRHAMPFAIGGGLLTIYAIVISLPVLGAQDASPVDTVSMTYRPVATYLCFVVTLVIMNGLWLLALRAEGAFRPIWCIGSVVTVLPIAIFCVLMLSSIGQMGLERGSASVPADYLLPMYVLTAAYGMLLVASAGFATILWFLNPRR